MSSLATAQNQYDAGVGGFTNAEHKRVRAYKIPGEPPLDPGNGYLFGPRDPTVATYAKAWLADNAAKLASMERAER